MTFKSIASARFLHGEVVYFVLCETTGLVKIGKTMNARQRIENLRAMSPVPLRPIHMLPGYGHEELALHAHFAATAGARARGGGRVAVAAVRPTTGSGEEGRSESRDSAGLGDMLASAGQRQV